MSDDYTYHDEAHHDNPDFSIPHSPPRRDLTNFHTPPECEFDLRQIYDLMGEVTIYDGASTRWARAEGGL